MQDYSFMGVSEDSPCGLALMSASITFNYLALESEVNSKTHRAWVSGFSLSSDEPELCDCCGDNVRTKGSLLCRKCRGA